ERDRFKEMQQIGREFSESKAGDIAKLFRQGKIEGSVFEEIYEVAKDPNHMKRKEIQHFMKAVADGKFPNKRAKGAIPILKALQGSDEEKKYASELVRKLSQKESQPLSAHAERTEIEKLKALHSKAETVEELKDATSTGTRASSVAQTAETSNRVEHLESNPFQNWELEKLPPEVAKKAGKAIKKHIELVNEIDALDLEIERTKPAEKAKIKKLKDRRKGLVIKLKELEFKTQKEMNTWDNHMERLSLQFQNLFYLKKRTGLALEDAKDIRVQSPEKANQRRYVNITIDKIEFEPVEFEDNGYHPENYTGRLTVHYTNEKGEKQQISGTEFLKMIDTMGGYEDVQETPQLEETCAKNLQFKTLEECKGQTFTNMDGKQFTLQQIQERDGKKVVILDKAVLTTPKQWKATSAHNSLYVDEIKKDFTLGEFQKLILQHDYVRQTAPSEEKFLKEEHEKYLNRLEKKYMQGATAEEEALLAEMNSQHKRFIELGGGAEELAPLAVPYPEFRAHWEARDFKKRYHEGGSQFIDPDKDDLLTDEERLTRDTREVSPEEREKQKNISDRVENVKQRKGQQEAQGAASGGDESKIRKDYHEEALPYAQIHKTGGMISEEKGFMKTLWGRTVFLSVSDIWELCKSGYEYYQRRFERRQKNRYSTVAKDVPFFAPEMRRIKQSSENDQVNQFKESFEQKGVYEVQERLQQTHNQDEMKAAFMILSDKGQIRWDDISMWKNLNRFTHIGLTVPIPSNGDPNTWVSEKDKRTGFDYIKDAVDYVWGEGTYNGWYFKNKSTYQSNAKGYYEEGKALEGVDGGHSRRLAELLRDHKEGRYVDPHEYEGLIMHSIDAGKSLMQPKIYYMLEGVAYENSEGRTILSFDRMAHLNSEMLNQFPILEYLCAQVKREDGKIHRWTIDDYKRWVSWFDEGNSMNHAPTRAVDEFMWRYVIPSDQTQNRINKALRNGEKLDHDDMFAYLPPATTQILTDSCKATTGSKKFLTVEGYANAFPGFSEYFRSLARDGNRNKLAEAVKSYVRYEGIMTNRFEKERDIYQRMDAPTLNSATIVSNTPPQAFIDQLNEVVEKVVYAYNDETLIERFELLKEKTGDVTIKDEREHQNRINQAFKDFDDLFTDIIKSDGGAKLEAIIGSANLEGMPFIKTEEKERRKAEAAKKYGVE
ncbi:MAG: hypothetical protein V1679_02590, partial [Candidatus Peregrinibacteria bacterium]